MKRIFSKPGLTFLFALLVPVGIWAQATDFGPCRQDASWEDVRMVDEIPAGLDKFLVITNRADGSDKGQRVLFPNELDQYRRVTYLWAACREGEWMLAPAGDFRRGMEGIDDGRDLLFFVHGHGKSLPLVLTRSEQIRQRYKLGLIVFDWPSYNSNFNKSLSRVRRCGENFYNHLLLFQSYRTEVMKPGQHLSLFMHSLGNYFLSHLVVNGNNQYLDGAVFDNVVLNAAAIRTREHGEVLSQLRMQERIYVALNDNDRILRGAHLLTSGRMLGNMVMAPVAPNVCYVDFTSLAGQEHTYFAGYHAFENEEPAFRAFYDAALGGREVSLDHKRYFRAGEGACTYLAVPAAGAGGQ